MSLRKNVEDALQNHKIISLLASADNHVIMQDPAKQPIVIKEDPVNPILIVPFTRVSGNKATTQSCFCDVHDTQAFKVIESLILLPRRFPSCWLRFRSRLDSNQAGSLIPCSLPALPTRPSDSPSVGFYCRTGIVLRWAGFCLTWGNCGAYSRLQYFSVFYRNRIQNGKTHKVLFRE